MSTPADTRQQWYQEMAELFGRDVPDSDPRFNRYENILGDPHEAARLAAHFGRLAMGEEEQMEEKHLTGLWRKNAATPEGKYLVKRRDGSIVDWPNFVIGAKDPCAPAALRAYADEAERRGFHHQYVQDVTWLADEFERYRDEHGTGDPDRGRHRDDDPATIAEIKRGGNS